MAGNAWTISGYVFNQSNKERIPFVNIIIAGKSAGTTTDIDGYFSLSVEDASVTLNFSHISYEPKSVVFSRNDSFPVEIFLKPVLLELKEVAILPEENPAHRIIDSLIAHIPDNDPKNIPFYTCSIYEKINATIDSSARKMFEKEKDTSLASFVDFFSEYDLFVI
jgi:hypothetical protein